MAVLPKYIRLLTDAEIEEITERIAYVRNRKRHRSFVRRTKKFENKTINAKRMFPAARVDG